MIAIILIGITIFYFYSAEQGKIRGYNFGNDLQIIQEELKNEQSSFYSNVRMWEENSITKSEILKLSETHDESVRVVRVVHVIHVVRVVRVVLTDEPVNLNGSEGLGHLIL